jgi:hypothetical protein
LLVGVHETLPDGIGIGIIGVGIIGVGGGIMDGIGIGAGIGMLAGIGAGFVMGALLGIGAGIAGIGDGIDASRELQIRRGALEQGFQTQGHDAHSSQLVPSPVCITKGTHEPSVGDGMGIGFMSPGLGAGIGAMAPESFMSPTPPTSSVTTARLPSEHSIAHSAALEERCDMLEAFNGGASVCL